MSRTVEDKTSDGCRSSYDLISQLAIVIRLGPIAAEISDLKAEASSYTVCSAAKNTLRNCRRSGQLAATTQSRFFRLLLGQRRFSGAIKAYQEFQRVTRRQNFVAALWKVVSSKRRMSRRQICHRRNSWWLNGLEPSNALATKVGINEVRFANAALAGLTGEQRMLTTLLQATLLHR